MLENPLFNVFKVELVLPKFYWLGALNDFHFVELEA